jgi:histidine phosphotransfer protein HptB
MLHETPAPSFVPRAAAKPVMPDAREAGQIVTVNEMDIELLRQSLGEDADRIIDLFLQETADRLQRMRALGERAARGTLAREAHSLKSAAATFGCPTLSALALSLEEEARSIDATALPGRLAALTDAYERAHAALVSRLR